MTSFTRVNLGHDLDRHGERIAIVESGGSIVSYTRLEQLVRRAAGRLLAEGVSRGDRVGVCLPKSADAVVAILAAVRVGAAYVPLDPSSPPARTARSLHECGVRLVFARPELAQAAGHELRRLGAAPVMVELPGSAAAQGMETWSASAGPASEPRGAEEQAGADDPAYVLYTSGSTGTPKGVVLTRGAVSSFIDWYMERFAPRSDDRFACHAPLHFAMSVSDVFAPLRVGGSIALIDESLAANPRLLAPWIENTGITFWFSTPSALTALEQHGHLVRFPAPSLRFVMFAGEAFPPAQLVRVMQCWPAAHFVNVYGSTETNMRAVWEVSREDAGRLPSVPIGPATNGYRFRLLDGDGLVDRGSVGELLVTGRAMLRGYWNAPERDAEAIQVDADGTRWLRTGDMLVEQPDGTYTFRGRRDRMVKRRGVRIELAEVELALASHPGVAGAACVALPDSRDGIRLTCFVVALDEADLSAIELKGHCTRALPSYMLPDDILAIDEVPRTATGKTDLERLAWLARAGRRE